MKMAVVPPWSLLLKNTYEKLTLEQPWFPRGQYTAEPKLRVPAAYCCNNYFTLLFADVKRPEK